MPVTISTLGVWHPDEFSVLYDVLKNVAVKANETHGKFRGVLMQRHDLAAAMSNAA